MRSLHFFIPGDLDTLTGGYLYDRRITSELRRQGVTVVVHPLSASFPWPNAEALEDARQKLLALDPGALVLIDGLAFGAMPEIVQAESERLDLVALVHHPLALESGLMTAQRDCLFQSEREALKAARHVIVTSPGTAEDLADYSVDPGRISIVLPGLDPAPPAEGSAGPDLALLCVASLTPRKGHRVLIEALRQLKELPWRLCCVGGAQHDPDTAQEIHALVENQGLAHRIDFVGECRGPQLSLRYQKSDVFVLASHHEGYGMALSEAMAHGLPVVSTTAGAIPGTVPTSAGLLVPPGDPTALAVALERVLTNDALRRRLSQGARVAAAALPDWPATAGLFAQVLARVTR